VSRAAAVAPESLTLEEAERWLLDLELFGMTFGLERMRLLMAELGSPQRGLRCVHVVGSNGKSSTTRMTAAILERHGLRSGEYLSPHLVSFTERVRVAGRDVAPDAFAGAAAQVRRAAAAVDAGLPGGERVTQFEALTATGLLALSEAGVEVAVVEAGLGGRHDATSVIDAEVQVLTAVGLEHTRWLGETIAEIAAEKVAVVRPGATLVVGADLHPDALAVAREVCEERGARLVVAPPLPAGGAVAPTARTGRPVPVLQGDTPPGQLDAAGLPPYQRANLALARSAAAAVLGRLDEAIVAAVAAGTAIPGRFEVVAERPVTLHDGAHNPDGMRALAAALGPFAAGRPLVACVSVLDDKDARAMLRALLPLCAHVVLTHATHPRAVTASDLQAICAELGGPPAEVVEEPHAALERARELAGPGGVALATGSLYLLADLRRPPGAARRSIL
jgi:dihydrofolate synthase/folylpolyglutamate synthase